MTDHMTTIKLERKPLFDAGQLVATPGAMDKVSPLYAMTCLARHICGDWGLLDEEDTASNDEAAGNGGRLLSAYPLPDDPGTFWIITEHDRSVTTFLLPSEY